MSRLSKSRRLLEESRRQELVAIDFYNRPGDRRSYSDFIVHLHLAWQYLLLASCMQVGRQIYYKNKRKYIKNADGSRKTWDLSKCLKEEYQDNDPIRINLEFFIGLRNRVEHSFEDSLLEYTAAEAHACIINYESELVRRFGDGFTLSADLKIPVFIHSLQPAQYDRMAEMQRGIPKAALNYITKFIKSMPPEVAGSKQFCYRLALIPVKGPKTQADMALTFVNRNELTEDDIIKLSGNEGSVIIAEKFRNVLHGDKMRPKEIAKSVEDGIPFRFSIYDFTQLRKRWKVGSLHYKDKRAMSKSDSYCLFLLHLINLYILPSFGIA